MAVTITVPDILVVGSRGRFMLDTDAPAPPDPGEVDWGTTMEADGDLFMKEFPAEVTYLPNGGIPRTIFAIIDRAPPENIAEALGNLAPSIIITVRNDDTEGISSSEFSKTLDQINLPVRFGETPVDRPITTLLWNDQGMCRFGVG